MAELCLKLVTAAVLLLCGVMDCYRKKIYLWIPLTGGLLLAVCIFFSKDISLTDRLAGVLVGAAVMLLSYITGGKIGMADGIVLCVTGAGLGFWGNMELFCLALMLAAVISIILLILRKANRNMCLPFIPFILTGYLILIFT